MNITHPAEQARLERDLEEEQARGFGRAQPETEELSDLGKSLGLKLITVRADVETAERIKTEFEWLAEKMGEG